MLYYAYACKSIYQTNYIRSLYHERTIAMADNRILQIIDTELVKAVTFIDFEDEKIMNEELSDSELIDVAVSRKCWSFTLGTLREVKDAMERLD